MPKPIPKNLAIVFVSKSKHTLAVMLLNIKILYRLLVIYRTVKKFGRKKFGELKSIHIGNVMKIVKIGEKLGEM